MWTRARRSRSSSRLRPAARIWVALSLSSLCDAPSSTNFNSSPVAPGTSPKVVVTTLSWALESSPSWRASVKSGSLAARDAAARRPLAAPLEEPESFPSHSAADPWPSLVCSPLSTTFGVNRATPEPATRSASLNKVTYRRADSAREAYGDGTPHDIAHEPHGLLDSGELGRLGGRRRLD